MEIFKSFRVSIDDPCRVVLPVALKRYNITDDWRQYALYIVYGDQERCLGLEEKPLMLFKQLDREGRKPMFMLRRHASPQEGWSTSTTQQDSAARVSPWCCINSRRASLTDISSPFLEVSSKLFFISDCSRLRAAFFTSTTSESYSDDFMYGTPNIIDIGCATADLSQPAVRSPIDCSGLFRLHASSFGA